MAGTMQTRQLGDRQVSVIGLGCSNFGGRVDEATSRAVITAALDAGVTLFDTADSYGDRQSEEILGRALAHCRDDVVIATKYGAPDGDPKDWGPPSRWIVDAADASLRRLGIDRIDLFQQHFPPGPAQAAPRPGTLARAVGVSAEVTAEVLDGLVRAGKVQALGSSNCSGAELDQLAAAAAGRTPFASMQGELSMLRRAALEDELPACERLGVAFLPYFPLASGVLSGKYSRGVAPSEDSRLASQPAKQEQFLTPQTFDLLEALTSFAKERSHTLLELAFAWLLSLGPVSSVIAGAMTPDQMRINAAAGQWRLTADDITELDRVWR
jgi:aryl-alcohol dehydrogenase-like predicted oxidoreductase